MTHNTIRHHIMKTLKVCIVACAALLATSCDVHEFPGAQTEETIDNSSDVTLHLLFDTAMPLHSELIYTRSLDEFDAYYHVEIYEMLEDGTYDDEAFLKVNYVNTNINNLNHDIALRLNPGKYRVIAWTHYVEDQEVFKRFAFDNLKTTSISDYQAYNGNSDMADAFRSVKYIDIASSRAGQEFDVEMTRPVAKFEVYATDIDKFTKRLGNSDLTEGKYTAKIIYSGYVPSVYDLIMDYVKDSRLNLSFTGPITMINDHEARIGFDYLFVNTWGGGVTISMEIYNTLGTRVAQVKDIEVPLRQGYLTVLRGEFMSSNSSGVGISSEFIGPDINIRF